MQDRKDTEDISAPLVKEIADKFEVLLQNKAAAVSSLGFHGCDFGMDRLGFVLIPYILRRKIRTLKSKRLKLENGPVPPRKDGGYGWFIVEETVDEDENCAEYDTGCNVAGDNSRSKNEIPSYIYYYWISKYFDSAIYHNRGTRWLYANGIPQNSRDGIVKGSSLSAEDAASLIQNNLLVRSEGDYKLNFACFTEEQFEKFIALFAIDDELTDGVFYVEGSCLLY